MLLSDKGGGEARGGVAMGGARGEVAAGKTTNNATRCVPKVLHWMIFTDSCSRTVCLKSLILC